MAALRVGLRCSRAMRVRSDSRRRQRQPRRFVGEMGAVTGNAGGGVLVDLRLAGRARGHGSLSSEAVLPT
jgi:hypothetical protein